MEICPKQQKSSFQKEKLLSKCNVNLDKSSECFLENMFSLGQSGFYLFLKIRLQHSTVFFS